MNELLWNKIVAFDFDNPPAEYSFTLRLAKENNWTKNFTTEAILEYKKFMYLAATSQGMVSPSKIVDIVWHQHLIFTQSYCSFCQILGKNVQHIPSTHDKKDFQKFQEAASRTKHLYTQTFGKQPKAFWTYDDMFGSLNLRKSTVNLSSFIFLGILGILAFILPFRALMEPIYLSIEGADFIWVFIAAVLFIFMILEAYNQQALSKIIKKADKDAFIYQLKPSEVIYLKTQNIVKVINGFVSKLIGLGAIHIGFDYKMKLNHKSHDNSQEQTQIVSVLEGLGETHYPSIWPVLATKPVFANTTQAMDELKKYITNSIGFRVVFYINFVLLSLLTLLGVGRIITGLYTEKPVTFLVVLTAVVVYFSVMYLYRLCRLIFTSTVSNLYKKMLTQQPSKEQRASWKWDYFLRGDVALDTAFMSISGYIDKNSNGGTTCGTSCGSSCGGGCGGGCGGCGG
ncbi:glycine-rich domain-containing protein [Microscilla marina]|uniref:Uncharacterized protein n=1 Tax=Microscilla marina ATCC 23134 TaxID=313606 RepID=A1ZQS2_MICM2|nr:hypothetical protein [Microscilla marina]EAY27227.1 conserved hypothetical protein [Microscilla marina ATCC 23134]